MAVGDPLAVKVGPGLLFVAPIGTTEPTTGSGTLPSADWERIGYTDEGSEFTFDRTFEDITVAEELSPVRVIVTGEAVSVKFSMAELSAFGISVALNGGTIGSPSGGFVTFEPPGLGDEARLMLVWQSAEEDERWLFRRVLQVGSLAIPRRKGAAKAVLPVEFKCELPGNDLTNFKAWIDASLNTADPH